MIEWFTWVAFAVFGVLTLAVFRAVGRLYVEPDGVDHAEWVAGARRSMVVVGGWQWSLALVLATMGNWFSAVTLFAAGSFIVGGVWLQRRLDVLIP